MCYNSACLKKNQSQGSMNLNFFSLPEHPSRLLPALQVRRCWIFVSANLNWDLAFTWWRMFVSFAQQTPVAFLSGLSIPWAQTIGVGWALQVLSCLQTPQCCETCWGSKAIHQGSQESWTLETASQGSEGWEVGVFTNTSEVSVLLVAKLSDPEYSGRGIAPPFFSFKKLKMVLQLYFKA